MWQGHHFVGTELDFQFFHGKNSLKLKQQLHRKTFLSQVVITLDHQTDDFVSRKSAIWGFFCNIIESLDLWLAKNPFVVFFFITLWNIAVYSHFIDHSLLLLFILTGFIFHETWLIFGYLFLYFCCFSFSRRVYAFWFFWILGLCISSGLLLLDKVFKLEQFSPNVFLDFLEIHLLFRCSLWDSHSRLSWIPWSLSLALFQTSIGLIFKRLATDFILRSILAFDFQANILLKQYRSFEVFTASHRGSDFLLPRGMIILVWIVKGLKTNLKGCPLFCLEDSALLDNNIYHIQPLVFV